MKRILVCVLIVFGLCGTVLADNLGYTTIGGTGGTWSANLLVAEGPFTASASGTITKIWINCGGNPHITMQVYEDDGTYSGGNTGNPGALVAATAGGIESTCGTGNLVSQNVIGTPTITAGHVYWIAEDSDGVGIDYDAASGRSRFSTVTYSDGVAPDPFPSSPTVLGVDFTLYAEYTMGGGGGGGPMTRALLGVGK